MSNSAGVFASMTRRSTRARSHSALRAVAVSTVTVAALALAACAPPATSAPQGSVDVLSQAEIDKAMSTPTELTFWSWVPDIDQQIALFEDKYPDIKVTVVNAGATTAEYMKLRTALAAGTGAPDVVQMELAFLPTFTQAGDVLDLRPYGAADQESKFVDWTWAQVTGANGEVWAYPQDTGPLAMMYRADLFEKYGIDVPTTWDEYASASKTLHDAAPATYMTNMGPNEVGVFSALEQQAGAKPYEVDGASISIDANGKTSSDLYKYWNGLVQDDVIATDTSFTNDWFQAFNEDKYATWLTAAWGPNFLQGAAPTTAGKWRVAPLPQWDPANPSSGNWGGSTSAVLSGTKNPIAAAKFAEFINTDPEATRLFSTLQGYFPATKALLDDPELTDKTFDDFGDQQLNKIFSEISATIDPDYQYPPFQDQATSDWIDTVGKALSDKTDLNTALDEWQKRQVKYATDQGFTVN